jgi:hypothetical protein
LGDISSKSSRNEDNGTGIHVCNYNYTLAILLSILGAQIKNNYRLDAEILGERSKDEAVLRHHSERSCIETTSESAGG